MPYALFCQLGSVSLTPTHISIRLADSSNQILLGIAENIMVKVGDFVFPADFVIMEMPIDSQIPLILGIPLLNTADAIVRVKDRKISIGIGANRMNISCCKTVEVTKDWSEDCLVISRG